MDTRIEKDTMGEMELWYRLAGSALVGGSLVAKGGHTPYEPAALGCAILHGPHVANFAAAYERLDTEGAALQVSGTEDLAQRWPEAAADRTLAERAAALLAPDDLGALLTAVERALARN